VLKESLTLTKSWEKILDSILNLLQRMDRGLILCGIRRPAKSCISFPKPRGRRGSCSSLQPPPWSIGSFGRESAEDRECHRRGRNKFLRAWSHEDQVGAVCSLISRSQVERSHLLVSLMSHTVFVTKTFPPDSPWHVSSRGPLRTRCCIPRNLPVVN